MATSSPAEEKWENSEFGLEEQEHEGQEEEEEEEEALSLCDLPVNLIKEENNQSSQDQEANQKAETNQEEFDFGPWGGGGVGGGGSLCDKSSEMCAADDIFFQGQILPLRLSVCSESGLNYKFKNDSISNPSQCLSRSESLDHNSLGGFTSFSSRSSSTSSRSHNSSSGASTSSAATTASKRKPNPTFQNQFFTHPSPKPQIRLPSTSLGNIAGSNRPRNSSVWDFFRLGLVRTPGIELQDLKVRSSVSRNNSSSSSNSNSSIKNSSSGKINVSRCSSLNSSSNTSGCKINNASGSSGSSNGKINANHQDKHMEKQRKQSLLSGCSCSIRAVKPVPMNIAVIKRCNTTSSSSGNGNDIDKRRGSMSIEEKLIEELKMKRRLMAQQKQGKQAMSRHRTFEWIKELSHASYLNGHEEEAV